MLTATFRKLFKKSAFFKKGLEMAELKQIVEKNLRAQVITESINSEMSGLLHLQKQLLVKESVDLTKQVKAALSQLTKVELINGKNQICVPAISVRRLCSKTPEALDTDVATGDIDINAVPTSPREKNLPKEKKPAGQKLKPPEIPVDVGRLDLRVGKIIEVGRHPNADSLYLEKVDCGETFSRTVVSGLVKFIALEDMQNRMVVVMCNLKPAKMRGVISEAMVMCASTTEKVEMLSPPADSVPGDLVHCEGYTRQPDAQLHPKKKVFETCAVDLKTNESLVACYKGAALHVPGKGNVVAQSLKNVSIK